METILYFVRHSKVIYTKEDAIRPLSVEGIERLGPIKSAFDTIEVDFMVSSPFKRAVDTIKTIALNKNLTIECYDDLKERTVASSYIDDFETFSKNQWEDFNYKLEGGESINDVKRRGLIMIEDIVLKHLGKTGIVGTHGTFLASILNDYDSRCDFEFWKSIQSPDIIKVTYVDGNYKAMERIAF